MNKIYHLVWNELTTAWVAVAEHVKARGKRGRRLVLLAAAALSAPTLAQNAPAPTALPSGGRVVAGQAGISQTGAAMTIQQTSPRAAIDWNTFNVGSQAQVNFVQPGSSAVTLNRVQDGNPSQIFGRITANGQVFLSNPGGIYFAPGASVDVGGLVATTHRIGLDDFMAGRVKFERQGAAGSIVNEGELKAALGGYIALLAPEVRNQGVILATLGTVALAAGETFELQFDGNNTLAGLRVTPSTIKALVDNRSAVLAPGGLILLSAQALDRVQGGVIRNSGRIEATGLAQRGGRIVLDASERIENSGQIRANAGPDGPAGSVSLTAPEIVNAGSIEAKSAIEANAQAGSLASIGGSIQIQAGNLTQSDGGTLDTSAPVQGGSVRIQASGKAELGGRIDAAATAETAAAQEPSAGGRIEVQAAQIDLRSTRIDASGETGGRILVTAAGAVPDAPPAPLPAPEPGKLALQGASQVSTRGRRGSGGALTLLGDDITLDGTSMLDARGAAAGGTVLVGGGWQGGGGLHQARSVTMTAETSIDASATQRGDGGQVVLWSAVGQAGSLTTVRGSIRARGGAEGGNGGQVETSGHAVEIGDARIDAGADAGSGGLWLLDPYNYTIGSSQAATISSTLASGTSVTIETSVDTPGYGSSGNSNDAGNININGGTSITKAGGGAATLTLRAHGSIVVGNGVAITSSADKLNLVLLSDWDSANAGAIYLDGTGSAINIATNGGHVWLGGNGYAAAFGSTVWNGLTVGAGAANSSDATSVYEGLNLKNVQIGTAGGSVRLAGIDSHYVQGHDRYGVRVQNGTTIDVGGGSIEITGQLQSRSGGSSPQPNLYGVALTNSTLQTSSGRIAIEGGTRAGASSNNVVVGVYSSAATVRATGAGGSIALAGTVANAGNTWANGLDLSSGRSFSTTSGTLDLSGTVSGSYSNSRGLMLSGGSSVTSTSGGITLRGSTTASNAPGGDAFGTYLFNKVTVSSDSGAINIYGTANANASTGGGIWLGSTSGGGGDGNQGSGVGNGYNVAVVSNSGNVLLDARGTSTTAASNGWFHGFILIAYGSDKQLMKTGSGNLTIKGDANVAKNDSSGVQFQVNTATGGIHVLSTSGDIYVQGYQHSGSTEQMNNALRFTPGASVGSIRFGAASDGGTASGRITFEADSIWTNTGNTPPAAAIKVHGSGALAFQSTGASSVKNLVLPALWDFGSAHSSVLIGKQTETKWTRVEGSIGAAGPITVQAGDVEVWGNLTSTLAGAPIQLLARNGIWNTVTASTLTTNAGAVVLAADTDNNGLGGIKYGPGLTIDTRAGLPGSKSTALSGGGAVTLGGGNVEGTGYASGISSAYAEGIRIDNGLTVRSGGGEINLRGRSWVGAVGNGVGAWGVGFWSGPTSLTLDSGAGRIRIEGIGRSSGSDAYKQGIVANGAISIQSAYAGNDAIQLLGTQTATIGNWRNAVDLGGNNSPTVSIVASGAGGGITIHGNTTYTALALRGSTQLLTNGGELKLTGTRLAGGDRNELYMGNAGSVWLGSAASSAVTASTSSLLLEYETFFWDAANGRPNIATSGAVTIRPNADSFGQSIQTSWFNWNRNNQTIGGLTLGKPSNGAQDVLIDGSNGNNAATVVVNGPVTAYGKTVTVSSPLTVTGSGDIYLEGLQNANNSVYVTGEISKTGGADATLTLKGAGRVNAFGGISASGAGTGKLNLVFWADSDANRYGGDSFQAGRGYTTNGGHIWIGGSATPGGSTTWNGLTVGDGASAGAYGANHNGMDLAGVFTTSGGDFYAAGKTYVAATREWWDINATGGSVTVNAGSGNVTFVGNRIDFGGIYTAAATTTISTTGTLTIRPYEDSFGVAFNIRGGLSGSDWLGSTIASVSGSSDPTARANAAISNNLAGFANLVIKNVAGLGGLTIGKETNTSLVTVRNGLAIAGDISLFGGRIANAAGAALTSTAGSILLDADLDSTLNFNGPGLYWSGALTASSTAAGKGNITLLGRGGTTAGSNNPGVAIETGSTIAAGGDVSIAGRAPAASNAGVFVAGAVSAGRTLAIDGRSLASVSAVDNQGLVLFSGAQLSAGGALSLTGRAAAGTTQALYLGNGVGISTTGTAGNSGITLTALDGGSIASSVAGGGSGNNTPATITAGAGSGISLIADRLDIVASRPLRLATTGLLSIESWNANFPSTFTWDGSLAGSHFNGAGSLANIRIDNLASLGGLTLGKAGNTSHIVVDAAIAAAGPVMLNGQDLTLNESVSAAGNATQASNRIVLNAGGTVTQNAALSAHGLALQGGGRYTLNHAGNDVDVIAAGSGGTPVGRLSFVDADGVAVGSVGSSSGITASGAVRVETLGGDLAVNASVATASTSADAVVLNAGRSKDVADNDFFSGAGGSLVVANGVTVSVGSGGLGASTGLAALVGSGSGRFRYASDEITTSYLTPLGTGVYAIYREQPTLTLKGADQSVVYGAEPALAVSATGLANGDTAAQSMGRLPAVTLMAGVSAAQRNAGGYLDVRRDGNGNVVGYGMTLSRNAVSSLGYALAYDDSATTTVTPKALAAVINDDAKFVGLADTPGYAGATYSGFVRGESAANINASATIVRSIGGEAVGSYGGALTGSVNVTAGNYTLDPAHVTPGSFHIVTPDTLIVRVGSAQAVYGGTVSYDVSQVRYYDSVAAAEVALTQGASEFEWRLGGNPSQAVSFSLASTGVNVGTHAITGTVSTPHTLPSTGGSTPSQLLAIGGRLTVTPRTLTVAASKVYDGSDVLTGHVTLGNLVSGETLTVTEAHASDRNVATANNYIRQLTLADGSGLASNYQLPGLTAYDAQTNGVTITARPLGVAVEKIYDGLATATAAQTTLTNLAPSEALTIQSVQLSDAHVATAGKYVSGLTLADASPFLLGNYSLPTLTAAGSRNAVSVTPQTLRVNIASATNTGKTYDGTTAAPGSFTATLAAEGYVAGDSGTLGGFSAVYDTKTVDAARIQLSGVALTGLSSSAGSQASDYSIDASAAFTAGSITPRSVSAASAAAPSKIYDGTTSVNGAVVTLAAATSTTGKVSGDDLSIVAVGGTFSAADAGTNRSYTLADITLAGADARNYVLASGTISGNDGTITPRPLTLTATRTYDGSTALPTVTLGNLAAGEYLLVSAAGAASSHVAGPDGSAATADNFVAGITLSDVLDGNTVIYKSANYSLPGRSAGTPSGSAVTLNAAAGNTVAVTPAPLTVTLAETQVSKVYDGSTAAAAGYTPGYVVSGLIGNDSAATFTQTSAFDAATVAGAGSFTLSAITLAGVTGSNGSAASDYALNTTTLTVPGSITARPLAVDTSDVRKTYDATTGFTNLSIGLVAVSGDADSGPIAGDGAHVAVVAGGGGFDTKHAGSGKSYSLTGLSLTGSAAGNYSLASGDSISGLNGVIDPKPVQVDGLSAVSKVYDGNTTAASAAGQTGTLLSATPGGASAGDGKVYGGDDVTLQGVATGGSYDSKDVATATRVDFTGFSLAGADAANYVLVARAAGSITPKALSATSTLAAKTYDASTSIAVTGSTLSGLVGSEQLVLTASAVLDDANAGSRTATLSYLLADGANGGLAGNYSLAGGTQAVTVAPKTLTLSGTAAADKIYDGSTAASVTAGSLSGFVGSETVGASVAGSFDSANAGSRTVTLTYTLADGTHGGLASNYTLAAPATLAASITPRTVTLSASKVYDGTAALDAGHVTIGGLVGSETLGYVAATASDAHVATAGKHIDAITLVDGSHGGLAGNYQLPVLNAANAPVTITPQALAATATIVGTLTKSYDGTTAASGAGVGGSVTGAIGGDTIVLDAGGITLAYDSAHVAGAGSIAANGTIGFTIVGSASGSQAGDYSFTAPTLAAVAAGITPAQLTATLTNAGVSKTYDGSTAAPAGFTPSWSVAGLAAGDSVTLAHTGAAYDSKDVAGASKITVSGLSLAAISGGNGSIGSDYVLVTGSQDVAASITPRTVTLTGLTAAGKTYDGTNAAVISHWGSIVGAVGSETLTLVTNAASASFGDAHAGSGKTVSVTGHALADGANGGLAGNYQLSSATATTTADIAKAVLVVIANDDAKFVTQSDAAGYGGVSYYGFVPGETAAVLGGAAAVTRSNAGTHTAGRYAGVLVPDVSGLSAQNYSFQPQNGSYTIVPSNQLLVRANHVTHGYGATPTYTIGSVEYYDGSAVVNLGSITDHGGGRFTVSDGAGGSATFTLIPANGTLSGSGQTAAGIYPLGAGNVSTQNAQNFGNTLTVVGSQTILPKALAVSAGAGPSKVYDGTTAMTGLSLGLAGVESGDSVGVFGQGAFSSKNVGSNIGYTLSGLGLSGADAGNYYLGTGASLSGSNGTITPRALTVVYGGVDKVYDGHTTAAVTTSDDRIGGDALTVHWSAAFADKNVGSGKTVSVTGVSLSGADAGNYTVAAAGSTTASITRLSAVAWVGGSSGNWFNPANWAGGAVPDLANVAHVVIPANTLVTFDTGGAAAPAQTAAVHIDGLGSGGRLIQTNGELNIGAGGMSLDAFSQAGGTLGSAGPVTLGSFTQSGGSTAAGADFSVSRSFSQGSTGSLTVQGNAALTSTSGGATLGNLSVAGSLAVTSPAGPVTQAGGTTISVQGTTTIAAGNHDITLGGGGNDFAGPFNASGRNITVVDGQGGLTLGDLNADGNLDITSTGGDVTQAGGTSLVVQGSTTIAAGNHDVTLGGSGNDFIGPFNASGRNITVVDGHGGLTLGDLSAGGDLGINSTGGDVGQADGTAIDVGGNAVLRANGQVRLARTGNTFRGETSGAGGDDGLPAVLPPAAPALVLPVPETAPAPLDLSSFGDTSIAANTIAGSTPAHGGRNVSVDLIQAPSASGPGSIRVTVPAALLAAGFSFTLPESLSRDAPAGARIAVTLDDGGRLPAWLHFDPERGLFIAEAVRPDELPLSVVVVIREQRTIMTISQ